MGRLSTTECTYLPTSVIRLSHAPFSVNCNCLVIPHLTS